MAEDKHSLSDAQLELASHVLAGQAQIASAYLLGSVVGGRLRNDSDIDVAVLPVRGAVFPAQDRLDLAARLENIFAREVDVGVLSTSNLVYAKEAVVGGRLFFERNHTATARFAMSVLSMYAELQEVRKEVLRAYAA
ncbi:MAG: type VII toxin-antitoxin system MntA family adenylyltransferase antitoxin [Chthoniobacterales bacterium]|jgi:predicted nucleotidyltransferase